MNLLRIQDALKNASDQQLVQMMQAPDSTAPSYLVLSEIRRRKDMRAKQAPEGDSSRTVAEELMADQQPLGIETLRHGPPERDVADLPEDQEEDDEAGIEAMRAGGIVRMQEGGTPPDFRDRQYEEPIGPELPEGVQYGEPIGPELPPRRGRSEAGAVAPAASLGQNRELPTLASLYRENQGLFADGIGALRERMQQERVDPAARRSEAMNMALIEAGLRIAGSRNPSLVGAIGEGALPAVQSYGQQLGQIRQEQRQARQDEIELAKQELNRQFAVGQISASELRARLSEVSADRRLAAQLAQQAGIADRQERAAEARLNRDLEARREQARLEGRLSFQEYMALPQEQREFYDRMHGRGRADVAGLSEAMRTVQQSITEIQRQIPLTPRDQRPALEQRLRDEQAFLGRLRDSVITGRQPSGMGGAGGAPGAGTQTERPPLSSFQR